MLCQNCAEKVDVPVYQGQVVFKGHYKQTCEDCGDRIE